MTLFAKRGRCPHCGHTNEPFVPLAAPQAPAAPDKRDALVLRRLTDEEIEETSFARVTQFVRAVEEKLAAKNGMEVA